MMQDFNHKHILVRAEVRNPPKTEDAMSAWLLDTVEAVGMKVLMGPFCVVCETEGNVGVTGAVVIETSHCSAHSWHEADVPFIQMDLYSCADFESSAFVAVLHKHFDAIYVEAMVVDRNCNPHDSSRRGLFEVIEHVSGPPVFHFDGNASDY